MEGESFKYPKSFDILVFRDSVAIQIREGKIEDIILISEYEYKGYPVLNGRGFGVNVTSINDLKELIEDYKKINYENPKENAEFSNKWFVFGKYRKLTFKF